MPEFDDPEIKAIKDKEDSQGSSEESKNDFKIVITETERVESGYFGMNSYVVYKIET